MSLNSALAVFAQAPNGYWIVAFSGGADSALALDLACQAANSRANVHVIAYYLHHYLTAIETERLRAINFLAERARGLLGDRFSLLMQSKAIDPRARRLRSSWEHTASLVRRRELQKLVRQLGEALVFTGHHYSDYLETLALRKERKIPHEAMPQLSAQDWVTSFYRPLYRLSRSEVRTYAQERGLIWYDDPSNTDRAIARNRIRQDSAANEWHTLPELPQAQKQQFAWIQPHWRELRLRRSDYYGRPAIDRARAAFQAFRKLSLVKKFTRNDFFRAQNLPFALPPYFVHEEQSAQQSYIIFRRGLGVGRLLPSPTAKSIRGYKVTRKLKIRMPYGRKAVTKIFSERQLSLRQRRLTWVELNSRGDEAVRIFFQTSYTVKPRRIEAPGKTLVVAGIDQRFILFSAWFLELWLNRFSLRPLLAQGPEPQNLAAPLFASLADPIALPQGFVPLCYFFVRNKIRTLVILNPDLRTTRKIRLAARLAGVKFRAGFATTRRFTGLNLTIPFNKDKHHYVHQLRGLFEYLTGARATGWNTPKIALPKTLESDTIAAQPYGIVALNTDERESEFLVEQFKKLVNLMARTGPLVLIFRSRHLERSILVAIARSFSEVMTEQALRETTLLVQPDAAEIFQRFHSAAWLVSADTELANLAGLMALPTLSVFGPHNERVWQPFSVRARTLTGDFSCRPCTEYPGLVRCNNSEPWICLKNASAELMTATLNAMVRRLQR